MVHLGSGENLAGGEIRDDTDGERQVARLWLRLDEGLELRLQLSRELLIQAQWNDARGREGGHQAESARRYQLPCDWRVPISILTPHDAPVHPLGTGENTRHRLLECHWLARLTENARRKTEESASANRQLSSMRHELPVIEDTVAAEHPQ